MVTSCLPSSTINSNIKIMNKFTFIIFFSLIVLSFISCKSVGGYYIRHGTGYVNDTLHYRITVPNSSNLPHYEY